MDACISSHSTRGRKPILKLLDVARNTFDVNMETISSSSYEDHQFKAAKKKEI